jgi:N-acetyl-anhydromuramyl-L-alanine amidase AmpD
MTRSVRRPYERVTMNVVNQSSRNGAKIKLIVLHDTESKDYPGSADLKGVGYWFNNPKAQASAHVCVDGEGRSAKYVGDGAKAWHCAAYNSESLGIEQIGYSTFTRAVWNRNDRAQLLKVAKYIAYWSKKYDIPIQHGLGIKGEVVRPGVVTHADLGQAGGGHSDPGPGYPFDAVLYAARYYLRRGWPSA